MSLRLILMVGLAGLSLSAAAAEPMTADALVAKNLEASGGADKLRAIKSMHMVGKARLGGGVEAKTESFAVGPDKIRFEFSLQGLTAVNAWDGKQAWAINPFQGRREPQKTSDDDAKGLILAADIAGPLLDWKAKGSKIEYLGTEDIDGTDAHKLRVTFKNGDSRVSFIDPDHFLEIRIEDHQFIRGQEQVSTTDLGEYALVDGVYFPFEQGQTHIDSIELNTPIDASIFALPTPKP
jgi:outer membrane lipoprotein-sorting protein